MPGSHGQILEGWRYDVFLSFCGNDTRKNFTDHLYHALRNNGIHAFRDDEELPRGGAVGPQLLEAIRLSKILVIVFSKNYASSTWCLDELLHIMKCSKSHSGQLFFPIFHNVNPSDIRRQKGTVAESFSKHESRYRLDKVQSWRDALTAAANFSGWDLRNRYEAECIEDIVREILKKLDSSHLHIASYPVGISSRVQDIYPLLRIGSEDVRVVGISGMGGIGKTTIAKAAYNEFSYLFEGKSFLADFREYSKKPEGKIHLQQKLLSDILKRHDLEFNSIDHTIKERLRQKRVLVVIDDVEDLDQFNSVAIDLNWFGPGSRIIVTTRNKHLLKQLGVGVNEIYIPEKLNIGESLELFSAHAFRTNEPPKEFLKLSRDVVEYCARLPLAVKVLGAFLFAREIPEWESTLELLKRTPNDRIQEKLRISFDALSKEEKDIFLDIACFFIGMDKDYVNPILDECGFYPGIGLSVLMDSCLVTVNDNRLMMHDLIRDMGREIVREKYPKSSGKRSRLWDRNDVIDVLTKYSGTDEVEGLSLRAQGLDAAKLKTQGVDVGKLDAKSFSTLRELRLLQLSHVQLKGSYKHFPKGLRWLCWHGFPSEFIPANFCLRSLAVMDMQYSNLRQFWKAPEAQPLKRLKFLDLSHSFWLRETPDFSYLPNLKKLLLVGCRSLVLVHKSVGILCDKLVLVNLKDCTELEDLPLDFYMLKSLKILILSGCLKLKNLDDALGEMEALETLLADCTAIREVPSSISQLKKLKILSLCGSKGSRNDDVHSGKSLQPIRLFPVPFQGLTYLRILRLSYCNLSDELIPKNLGSLPWLLELDLQGNSFCNLQTDFGSLPSLRTLRLDNCLKLQMILRLPRTLRALHVTNCISLERTPNLSECSSLRDVYVTNCINLVETPGLHKLRWVTLICMEMHNRRTETLRENVQEGLAASSYRGISRPTIRLPDSFILKDEQHPFIVPETLNLDLIGFTLCAHYIACQDYWMKLCSPKITVTNRTKGNVWNRWPVSLCIVLNHEEHLCICHLSNEEFHLEAGDQVEVDVDFGDQETMVEVGVLCEAEDDYAETLCKVTAVVCGQASNNPATTAIHEHSSMTGVALVHEAEKGHAESGSKAAIGYANASNKPGTVSIDEHSADINEKRPSVDEIQDEQLTETEDEPGGLRNLSDEANEGETEATEEDKDFSKSMDSETIKDTYAVKEHSYAPEIPRYQKQPPRGIEEGRKRPLRKTRPVLRTFLGALGFFAFIIVWEILVNPALIAKMKKENNSSSGRRS